MDHHPWHSRSLEYVRGQQYPSISNPRYSHLGRSIVMKCVEIPNGYELHWRLIYYAPTRWDRQSVSNIDMHMCTTPLRPHTRPSCAKLFISCYCEDNTLLLLRWREGKSEKLFSSSIHTSTLLLLILQWIECVHAYLPSQPSMSIRWWWNVIICNVSRVW